MWIHIGAQSIQKNPIICAFASLRKWTLFQRFFLLFILRTVTLWTLKYKVHSSSKISNKSTLNGRRTFQFKWFLCFWLKLYETFGLQHLWSSILWMYLSWVFFSVTLYFMFFFFQKFSLFHIYVSFNCLHHFHVVDRNMKFPPICFQLLHTRL